MKKWIGLCIIFAALLAVMVPFSFVSAEIYDYDHFYLKTDVVFYFEEDGIEYSFYLPATYYAKVEQYNYSSSRHQVSYNGLTGFVEKDDTKLLHCKFDTTSGSTSYYYRTLKGNAYSPIFKTIAPNDPVMTLDAETDLVFFGYNYSSSAGSDKNFYFIRTIGSSPQSGVLGYIPKGFTNLGSTDITIPALGIEPLVNPEGGGNVGDNNGPEEPKNSLLRILLIVVICLLCVLIVFIIFKPVKTKKGRYEAERKPRKEHYYEDDDDEYYRR